MNSEAPIMSWDDAEDEQQSGTDFLESAEAQEVPKACSIDNPDCEACQ
jgi:hypothetical protein